MSSQFVDYIKILGKGRNGSRSLTEQEAEDAMSLILEHQVAPEQMGAFWMLIRIREETVEEAAGFTRAIRKLIAKQHQISIKVDLDWPAYAGKRNELPWFLLAAFALSQSGIKTVMHGHSFDEDARIYVDSIINWLELPIMKSLQEAEEQLHNHNFAYIPLGVISPELSDLMNLKRLLGLRSPVNTVVRMMNPMGATHSVHGVFHTSYDELHIETAKLLKDQSVLVFRGGNGEAEVNPERDVSLGLLKDQDVTWSQCPKASSQHIRQKDNLDFTRLVRHWTGERMDEFGELAVIQTMAAVLGMVTDESNATRNLEYAHRIWKARNTQKMLG